MNKSIKKYCFSFLFFVSTCCTGQADNSFKEVDDYVKSLGALDSLNMGTISNIVTKKFPDNTDKVRAIFDWIAFNISFDCKLYRSSGNEKMMSGDVLKTRKANPYGYAALFQDMCSVAKIRCLTVDGYVKNTVEDINTKPDAFNHTWAVVQLGSSPEAWFYVDPVYGSGYTDEKMTTFTREYNDRYFFTEKNIFNLQHFPDNNAWLLGNGPRDLKSFLALPVIKNAAYEFDLRSFSPSAGYIKTKSKNPVEFIMSIGLRQQVDIVSLQVGTGKKRENKTVDYRFQNGNLYFKYQFAEEDTYPVNVMINNKIVLCYVIEVTE
jgi:transglutaminase/protease-like cytokinesis protein 3